MLSLLMMVSSVLGAGPVVLHFAWPTHLQGSVKHTYVTHTDASFPSIQAQVTYRFSVQDGANGLHKMVPSDVQFAEPTSAMAVGEPSILLFDDHGAFKGIDHTKGDLLDRMSDGPLPLPAEKKAEIRAQIEAIQLSEAREKWDELTGRWNGVTLMPGTPSKRAVKLGLGSMLGRTEVDAVEVTTLQTGIACEAASLEKACVRITMETNPSKPLPPKPDPFGMIEKKATRRVVIVLEPGTLVPYSIHLERADLVERDKETERHLQLDDVVFSYSPPGARKL